jgi:hypothetical protein
MSTKRTSAAKAQTRTRSHRAPKRRGSAVVAGEIAALNFDGIPVDLLSFSEQWDQARGYMARCAVGLARMNDKEMTTKFNGSAELAHGFIDMHDALKREISYLKTNLKMLDVVTARMLVVAHRFDPNLKRTERPQLSVAVDNTRGIAPTEEDAA